ncbi:hypothetical protein M885DRAFT_585331 [Pelagophyceae sp. CCMP2097]|nr:hypothetical protein M885DRAFT_585331 [Pelagophyceae sp. CCMP2097]
MARRTALTLVLACAVSGLRMRPTARGASRSVSGGNSDNGKRASLVLRPAARTKAATDARRAADAAPAPGGIGRRAVACACGACLGAALSVSKFDNGGAAIEADATFAKVMALGMADYERRPDVIATKKRLFDSMPAGTRTVLELGVGAGPNLRYYASKVPRVLALEPNDAFRSYAEDAAIDAKAKSFTVIHGVAEAIPLPDESVDCVVATMVLCSVGNVQQTLREVRRVLAPGGRFVFVEHVAAPKDWHLLAAAQIATEPLQVLGAGNCHLQRDPQKILEATFGAAPRAANINLDRFVLEGVGRAPPWPPHFLLAPHIAGFATKVSATKVSATNVSTKVEPDELAVEGEYSVVVAVDEQADEHWGGLVHPSLNLVTNLWAKHGTPLRYSSKMWTRTSSRQCGSSAYGTMADGAGGDEELSGPAGVKYVCGDCGGENVIKARDAVRCKYCGYRILYKVRTKRLIQFEAR